MGLHVNGNEDGKFLKGAMWNPDQNNSIRGLIAKSGEKVPQCVWTEKRSELGVHCYCEHDSEGREIRILYDYEDDGKPDMIKTCKYHDSGVKKEVVINSYYGNGEPRDIRTETYNEQGQILKETYDYNSDGKPDSLETYEYNELGQEVKHTAYDGNGIRYKEKTTEYLKNGHTTVRYDDYNSSGKVEFSRMHEYDEFGRILDGPHSEGTYHTKSYEYDDFGKLIRTTEDRDGDGIHETIEEY